MKCTSCGASLPPKSDTCHYCNSLNKTDLREVHYYTEHEPDEERTCPICKVAMKTLNIVTGSDEKGHKAKFYIERCPECFGCFFDPGELPNIVEGTVSNVYNIDYGRLDFLSKEYARIENRQLYVACPICQKKMNRKSHGARSGVITDVCKDHGVWLDRGELTTILRWAKAGGREHCERVKKERERARAAQKRFEEQQERHKLGVSLAGEHLGRRTTPGASLADLLDSLTAFFLR